MAVVEEIVTFDSYFFRTLEELGLERYPSTSDSRHSFWPESDQASETMKPPPGAFRVRFSTAIGQYCWQVTFDEGGQKQAQARGVKTAPVDGQAGFIGAQVGDQTGCGVAT